MAEWNIYYVHAGHGPFSHMFEHEVVATVMKVKQ